MSERYMKEFSCDGRNENGLLCGEFAVLPESAVTGDNWTLEWSSHKRKLYHFCPKHSKAKP